MPILNFKLGRIEKTDEESRAVPGYDGQYVSCGGHFLETPDGREFECAYDSTFNCADCVCNGGPYDPRYPYCERGDAEAVYRRLEDEPLLHIAARRLIEPLVDSNRNATDLLRTAVAANMAAVNTLHGELDALWDGSELNTEALDAATTKLLHGLKLCQHAIEVTTYALTH